MPESAAPDRQTVVHDVVVIGESLLPLNLALFEQPGVAEEVARTGMPKYGASTRAQVVDAIA